MTNPKNRDIFQRGTILNMKLYGYTSIDNSTLEYIWEGPSTGTVYKIEIISSYEQLISGTPNRYEGIINFQYKSNDDTLKQLNKFKGYNTSFCVYDMDAEFEINKNQTTIIYDNQYFLFSYKTAQSTHSYKDIIKGQVETSTLKNNPTLLRLDVTSLDINQRNFLDTLQFISTNPKYNINPIFSTTSLPPIGSDKSSLSLNIITPIVASNTVKLTYLNNKYDLEYTGPHLCVDKLNRIYTSYGFVQFACSEYMLNKYEPLLKHNRFGIDETNLITKDKKTKDRLSFYLIAENAMVTCPLSSVNFANIHSYTTRHDANLNIEKYKDEFNPDLQNFSNICINETTNISSLVNFTTKNVDYLNIFFHNMGTKLISEFDIQMSGDNANYDRIRDNGYISTFLYNSHITMLSECQHKLFPEENKGKRSVVGSVIHQEFDLIIDDSIPIMDFFIIHPGDKNNNRISLFGQYDKTNKYLHMSPNNYISFLIFCKINEINFNVSFRYFSNTKYTNIPTSSTGIFPDLNDDETNNFFNYNQSEVIVFDLLFPCLKLKNYKNTQQENLRFFRLYEKWITPIQFSKNLTKFTKKSINDWLKSSKTEFFSNPSIHFLYSIVSDNNKPTGIVLLMNDWISSISISQDKQLQGREVSLGLYFKEVNAINADPTLSLQLSQHCFINTHITAKLSDISRTNQVRDLIERGISCSNCMKNAMKKGRLIISGDFNIETLTLADILCSLNVQETNNETFSNIDVYLANPFIGTYAAYRNSSLKHYDHILVFEKKLKSMQNKISTFVKTKFYIGPSGIGKWSDHKPGFVKLFVNKTNSKEYKLIHNFQKHLQANINPLQDDLALKKTYNILDNIKFQIETNNATLAELIEYKEYLRQVEIITLELIQEIDNKFGRDNTQPSGLLSVAYGTLNRLARTFGFNVNSGIQISSTINRTGGSNNKKSISSSKNLKVMQKQINKLLKKIDVQIYIKKALNIKQQQYIKNQIKDTKQKYKTNPQNKEKYHKIIKKLHNELKKLNNDLKKLK